jgi:pyrroline-5-carboxylate reductase
MILMKAKSFGFIGGGRVARIILGGFKKKDKWFGELVVSDDSEDALKKITAICPEAVTCKNANAQAASRDIVFLALHPPAIGGVLEEIKPHLQSKAVLVSLAPKASIASLSAGLGGFNRIVRMIPNAPTVINKGYNPVAFSGAFDKEEKKDLSDFFKVLGDCPEVAEEKLESYAILTAMGPTYFWFQIDELRKLGESFGLTSKETEKGISKMMKGTVKTLFESGLSLAEVMDLVPLKPLGEEESNIRDIYRNKLSALYQKLKG